MFLPEYTTSVAMAETHGDPTFGSRPFSDTYGNQGGGFNAVGPCSPVSNASNIANPPIAAPVNPPAPGRITPGPGSQVANAAAASSTPQSSAATSEKEEPSTAKNESEKKGSDDKDSEAKSVSKGEDSDSKSSGDAKAAVDRGKILADNSCTRCHSLEDHPMDKNIEAVTANRMPEKGSPEANAMNPKEKADLLAYLGSL